MADSLTAAPHTMPAPPRRAEPQETPVKIAVDGLNFFYGDVKVLHGISVGLLANQVSAFICTTG